ncbi:MAG: hypothetical protein ACOYLH_09580 [Flavobacteriales bacterium]|jgi:UDP-N-acetylglucosamine 2-epimerase
MTAVQHEQMTSLMNTLNEIQERMSRSKHMFPNHHAQLQQRYEQLVEQAKMMKLTPPWLAA